MGLGFAGYGVTAAALAAALAWEVGGFALPPVDAGMIGPAPQTAMPAASGAADAVSGWMTAALARPLFQQDRRPSAVDDRHAGASVRLAAVLTGDFGARAIFMPAADGRAVVVQPGDRIGELLIRAIGPGWVAIEVAGSKRILRPAFINSGTAGQSPITRGIPRVGDAAG
jgi:hypothetical protein